MILPIKQHLRPRYTLYNLSRGLEFAVDALIGFLFVSGALAMFVMVVTRYGFSWSDPSIEILVRYSMIWGTFVGVAAAVRFGVNIRFTMLEKLFGEVGRRRMHIFSNSVSLILAIGLAISGWALAEETLLFNEIMPTALRWQIWPFHGAIFVGAILLILQIVSSLLKLISKKQESFAIDTSDLGI